MFVARPPAAPPAGPPGRAGLRFVRGAHGTSTGTGTGTGTTEFLADAGNRARVSAYLSDLTRPYGLDLRDDLFAQPPSAAAGQSYGELAQPLIGQVVSADEPVDLLILAFAVHDLRPGRQTAAYLSHLTPGAPLAFALCDQGSAAAFTGLRIASEYAATAGIARALLIAVEQAVLPYHCPVPLPTGHQAVAMLFGTASGSTSTRARIAAVRQRPGIRPADVADLAAADLKDLAASHREVTLVLSATLAALWSAPAAGQVLVLPPGQPSTGVWCTLIDVLAAGDGPLDLLVAADYDAGTGCLSLAGLIIG